LIIFKNRNRKGVIPIEFYADKVTVKCGVCKNVVNTEMRYGLNLKYEDDFEIKCPKCDNFETGTPPLQSFDFIKDHGRREMSQEEAESFGIEEDDGEDDE
jgi:hypothetical protein